MIDLSKEIDYICEKINLMPMRQMGIDIALLDVIPYEDTLCKMFSIDGEVLTCEARFDNISMFCYGKSAALHRAWVDSH